MRWKIAAPGPSSPSRWHAASVRSMGSCRAPGRSDWSRRCGPWWRCGAGGYGHLRHNEDFMLRDDINNALKNAMKARDEACVSTLRLVNSTLKNADIEARGQGKPPLTDDEVLGVLQKMIKQRQESAELYEKGGRPELAAKEQAEIEIISGYLPKQMSDIEAGAAIQALVHEINAQTM